MNINVPDFENIKILSNKIDSLYGIVGDLRFKLALTPKTIIKHDTIFVGTLE